MGEIFERRNMAETVFRDVNLFRAVFDNVNLAEARIHNANLGGLCIDDAFIGGLTIFGMRVDELIEAELDRRDPERVRLRMADRFDPECVGRILRRLDEVRAEFIAWLRAADPALLTTRPAVEQWSVIENLRHLVFAEDLYTNRWLLQNDEPWCTLGLRSTFLDGRPDFSDVGSQPSEDLEAILAAWAKIHARLMAFAASVTPEDLHRSTREIDFGQGTVGGVLQGLAQHDLEHIRQAEMAVRKMNVGQAFSLSTDSI